MSMQTKYLLNESQMPDLVQHPGRPAQGPAAGAAPGTMQPVGPADLAPLFPMELILQEVSTER